FPIFCEERDALQSYLSACGVQTLIHYPIPPHEQDCYKGKGILKPEDKFPVTEKIHRTVLSLPISPVMTDNEVDTVIESVNSYKN
ncbi:MAG: DegT/DnrJ/EryC1/StrS family aminotransferase, partial [Muribaculaceae bacterium]|nr:DegT/DnrJ/EryC1/StrS family aminotransferase [Muribaculaceae bacterium]